MFDPMRKPEERFARPADDRPLVRNAGSGRLLRAFAGAAVFVICIAPGLAATIVYGWSAPVQPHHILL